MSAGKIACECKQSLYIYFFYILCFFVNDFRCFFVVFFCFSKSFVELYCTVIIFSLFIIICSVLFLFHRCILSSTPLFLSFTLFGLFIFLLFCTFILLHYYPSLHSPLPPPSPHHRHFFFRSIFCACFDFTSFFKFPFYLFSSVLFLPFWPLITISFSFYFLCIFCVYSFFFLRLFLF